MKHKLAYLGIFSLLLITIFIGIASGYLYQIIHTLPDIQFIQEYTPGQITRIYAEDDQQIASFCLERRTLVPMSEISQNFIKAILAIEDANFYQHKGIYWPRVIQAFWKNLKSGHFVQGASTITQQLARSIFLYPQKTISRKIKEAFLAYKIEKKYSKKKILELYVNQIYFGSGAYGVEAAAKSYFEKKAIDLKIAEGAFLAGLIKAPSKYSPFRNPDLAQKRCRIVLKRLREEKFITQEQHQSALQFPFEFQKKEKKTPAPYFVEYIRQCLQNKFGRSGLYKNGLQVYTALNLHLQKTAQKSLQWGLERLDKRQGFRPVSSPIEDITISEKKIRQAINQRMPMEEKLLGVVKEIFDEKVLVDILEWEGEINLKDMRWAKVKHPGEILKKDDKVFVRIKEYQEAEEEKPFRLILALEQVPLVQGALVALEPKTGFIRALVGGYDFSKSQFNRAVQAHRQPGSSFKPFIYTAALGQGKTLADIIIDSPIIYKDKTREKDWKPANYYEKFNGPTTFRHALEHSSNVVTVKLLKEVGVDHTIDLVRKMGITSPLSPDLSLALGASGVTLLELTSAYGVFAAQGVYTPPIAIKWILNNKGQMVEKNAPSPRIVLDKQLNYLITSLLEGVVQHGTGWRAKSLRRPVGGKTGTTNEYNDAWFIGFSPDLVVGVWVGFDKYRSLGEKETGSRAACPIWVKFMSAALEDRSVKNFPIPTGISFMSIDADTGMQATPDCENIIVEAFREGTEPKKLCNCKNLGTDRFLSIDFQAQKTQARKIIPHIPKKSAFSPD